MKNTLNHFLKILILFLTQSFHETNCDFNIQIVILTYFPNKLMELCSMEASGRTDCWRNPPPNGVNKIMLFLRVNKLMDKNVTNRGASWTRWSSRESVGNQKSIYLSTND